MAKGTVFDRQQKMQQSMFRTVALSLYALPARRPWW
jgi:hypothetical protein